jgi:hypothetical protein
VGYARGGVLTEAVRRRPYSVVLLDEVEKAHPDVLELFYQVFDKGTLEDGQGVVVDFRNTALLLTSNAGAELIEAACASHRPPAEQLVEALRPRLTGFFPPALLGRLTLVPYYPLGEADLRRIVDLKIDAVRTRYHETHHAALEVDPAAAESVLDRCLGVGAGARSVDHILAQEILPRISSTVLERMLAGKAVEDLVLSVDAEDRFVVLPAQPAPRPAKRTRRRPTPLELPPEARPEPRAEGRPAPADATLRTPEPRRDDAERQALEVERRHLEVERRHLEVERESMAVARQRFEVARRSAELDTRPTTPALAPTPVAPTDVPAREVITRPETRDTAPGTTLAPRGLFARMGAFLRSLFQSR